MDYCAHSNRGGSRGGHAAKVTEVIGVISKRCSDGLYGTKISDHNAGPDAAAAGTFALGDDLVVNHLGFGAMRLTGKGIRGEPEDPEEARRVLRRAIELGVTLLDTAASYSPEGSEHLLAEALHPYPDDLVIATKGGFTRPGGR